MRAIEAFNETSYGLEAYGIFEDGWNAALKDGDSTPHNISRDAIALLKEVADYMVARQIERDVPKYEQDLSATVNSFIVEAQQHPC